jgi:hypothetical protein
MDIKTTNLVRFVPTYRERAWVNQCFLVQLESREDNQWRFIGYADVRDYALLQRITLDFPVLGVLVRSLLIPEGSDIDRRSLERAPYLEAQAVSNCFRLIDMWSRAEFLLRIQGMSIPDDWLRDKRISLRRAHAHDALTFRDRIQQHDVRIATPRKHRGVIYLVHGEPLSTMIGYVGQTVDEGEREEKHLSGADPSTQFLISNIAALGMKPVFTVLQSCPAKYLNRQERAWYKRLSVGGWELYNKTELASHE